MLGKVYKITNHIDDKIYIGSTITDLNHRFSSHKSYSINATHANSKLHKHIRTHGPNNFQIELIEQHHITNYSELRAHENKWIHALNTISNGLNDRCAVMDINQRKHNMRAAAVNAQQNNRLTGKYKCIECDVNFSCKYHLTQHNLTNKHINNSI